MPSGKPAYPPLTPGGTRLLSDNPGENGTGIPLKARYAGFGISWDVPGPGIGGASRDRTDDLFHAMEALSQLSYGPVRKTLYLKGIIPPA